ncbi:sensor histidine kinase [Robertkochia solimangrovi]|uniref:sensor histidine kinase n=1 Tax=Robertkochia solimangrovi TaxID=2213046 RepID=UPI00117D5BB4|nr:HAMP domain-containing sensor histidine kinase [Robertkochia solimangrovi]TRZ42957.1 sensor histidine kinase [Robertkochia solimangrovi]
MNTKSRLIKKSSKTFLSTGLVLALLSALVLYFYTKQQLQNEVEEVLNSTEARVENALENHFIVKSLPPVIVVKEVETLLEKSLKDTTIYDPSQDEMELFRELSVFKHINGKNYQITVREMVVESEDFLFAIMISNITIFGLAFLFLFYFNTKKNIALWRPFFKNLEQMKSFSLVSNEPLELVDSDVLEFSELKNEITTLTKKVRADYENLKQFTEDISHEMQTPLAIIQAKLDNIINHQDISDKQFDHITSIQEDILRLKQLNKKVTTLTKIDNNQFINIGRINLTTLIQEKVESYNELHLASLILIENDTLEVSMDTYLAEILVNNLISNAVKYNINNQQISINTNKKSLHIFNAGDKAITNPELLFLRFYRESNGTKSTGLGLAIVKKICDLYKFKVSYHFEKEHHVFSVVFSD